LVPNILLIFFKKERNLNREINYIKCNDYYLPNLTPTKKEHKTLNKYGLILLNCIKEHNKVLYQKLLMENELNSYLFSVGIEIEKKIKDLTNKLVTSDVTINENLKAINQMLWVQKMNSCKLMAEEIILNDYICEVIL